MNISSFWPYDLITKGQPPKSNKSKSIINLNFPTS